MWRILLVHTAIDTPRSLLCGHRSGRIPRQHRRQNHSAPVPSATYRRVCPDTGPAYDGSISASTSTGFTDTRKFRTASDDYVYTLTYLAAATANGDDTSGNPITGFKWWNFAYPTLLNSGTGAIGGFVSATNGAVNLGGTIGAVPTHAANFAVWNDPANPNGWSASATVLMPSTLPIGVVATGLAKGTFTMTVAGGTMPATIDVSSTSGSATLVYEVDRTNGVVTVSPIDITTSTGLTTLTTGLAIGAPVKVYGVPQGDGSLRSYVLAYFTGTCHRYKRRN
jgi:hypothetical protein